MTGVAIILSLPKIEKSATTSENFFKINPSVFFWYSLGDPLATLGEPPGDPRPQTEKAYTIVSLISCTVVI